MKAIPERDWKYLRKCQKDLLDTLCERINGDASTILTAEGRSPHERYRDLYEHIRQSDRAIAECFDDWRRSNVFMKLIALDSRGLLGSEHIENLSDETRERLQNVREIHA